ncbi:MAG: hypothetical protein WBD25_15615 [Terriglobales bacterium]|jgi:hypothetical protein
MNAPPISEGTFTVEMARRAIVDPELVDAEMIDPETELLAVAPEGPEFVCASDNPARIMTAKTAVENDLIETKN